MKTIAVGESTHTIAVGEETHAIVVGGDTHAIPRTDEALPTSQSSDRATTAKALVDVDELNLAKDKGSQEPRMMMMMM